ncbi:TetR family transcriptional regulator C-terminal domain-containing protein [Actinokineospora sp. PR83]|uniref:TetR/AcrR family transcriptional regulator n=1 Tax=Actinokineospora sp. PR83 TaxID=2884908 RepID=UPI001F15895A|nr:TetR family transcriptional regulator C-terminal domain-containing protein [Actinokineospora sp. PR83]MCG8919549.1 TetR family transcriptional regulator C-terminal domain-containing protein [Actinokineospora sp. PR83]
MPKKVDHQERREQIAAAVCGLAARQGLDAVTLRQVAAEAGVSMGRVQHYFTGKDEMLLFAFRAISDRVERRIAEAVAALGPEPGARDVVRALLREMLPLSAAAKDEAPALTAFLARAVVEPALAESLREGGAGLRGFIAEKIRAVPGERDAVREAATLTALVDGLMTQVLTGQVEADLAVSVLDFHLDRIFGGGPGAR